MHYYILKNMTRILFKKIIKKKKLGSSINSFFLPFLHANPITRMEKVVLRSSSSRAKIIGTVASISGASVVVLYKGAKVLSSPHCSSSSVLLQQPLGSPLSNWVIGGLLLAMGYVFYSFWYIIQVKIVSNSHGSSGKLFNYMYLLS